MAENDTYEPADEVTKVARNLSAIEDMIAPLLTQAIHKANDQLMPGGTAMVSLAAVASPEAWENMFDTNERTGRDTGYADDEDDTWEPVLQTLCFWSEQWRTEHGYLLDGRPTIASETNFIRWCLNWARENEAHFNDFARDIHQARMRLENILYAGRRVERSRVVCNQCADAPRLIKVYTWDRADVTGEGDRWKCTRCKHMYDEGAFEEAHREQLRSMGAKKFVPVPDAVSMLRAQGRSERTIRSWLTPHKETGETKAEISTDALGKPLVWWPDMWTLHLTTKTRDRSA